MKKFLSVVLALLICTVVFAAGYEVFGSVVPYGIYANQFSAPNICSSFAAGGFFGFDKYNDVNGFYYGAQAEVIISTYHFSRTEMNNYMCITPEFILGKTVFNTERFYVSAGGGVGAKINWKIDGNYEGRHKAIIEYLVSGNVCAEFFLTEKLAITADINASLSLASDYWYFATGASAGLGLTYCF